MIYWHVERGRLCVYSQLKSCSSSEVAAMIEGLLRHGTDAERSRRHTAVRSAIFMHTACPACTVQQSGHAGGVHGVVLTDTPDCPLPRPRSWSGPGTHGRPTDTSAARPASGRAAPTTRSGDADDHPRATAHTRAVQETGRSSGADGYIVTGTPS